MQENRETNQQSGTGSCELTRIDKKGDENENGELNVLAQEIKMNSILCKYSGLTAL
jgi:hypothetical protein